MLEGDRVCAYLGEVDVARWAEFFIGPTVINIQQEVWPISATIHATYVAKLLRGDDDGQLLCPYLSYHPQPPSTSLPLLWQMQW